MTDPLHDLDAEMCALALCLARPDEAFKSPLRATHFSAATHRAAWVSLRQCWEDGGKPDLVHVTDTEARAMLENLPVLGVTPLGPEILFPRLEKPRVRRAILDLSDRIGRMAMDGADPEHLETALHSMQFRAPGAGTAVRAADADDVMDDIEWRMEHPGEVKGFRVGLPRWEEHVDGVGTGYHVIAARPSQGKTALIVQMLAAIAEGGTPTLFLSLEMSAKQVKQRILSRLSGFPVGGYRTTAFTRSEMEQIGIGASRLRGLDNLLIWDMKAANLKDWAVCRSIIRKAVREEGVRAIGIDYIQLLSYKSDSRNRTRNDELTAISGDIKVLAEQLDVGALIAAQLRRPPTEHGSQKVPELSDIKDCGGIEQDADTVTFIHTYPETHLILEKNRNGPTCAEIPVVFQRDAMAFEEEDSVSRTLRKKSGG